MTGIKGVGEGVVQAILEERQRNGPYKSFYEFFKRIDTKRVGKKVIENLVEAGCFDFTGWLRDALVLMIDPIYEAVSKEQKEQAIGIISLFSLMGDSNESRFSKPPEVKHHASRQEMLRKEKELLGFFLTGHPMDEYKQTLQRLSCIPLRKIDTMEHDMVFRSAFIVESVQIRIASKSQKKFAILIISDGIERQELPIWADLYEEKSTLLHENQLLYAVLQVDRKGEELRLSCRWLDDLTKADESMMEACDKAYDKAKSQAARFGQAKNAQKPSKDSAKPSPKKEIPSMQHLTIKIDVNQTRHSHIMQLKQLFSQHAGPTPIQIHFHTDTRSLAVLHIEGKWGIALTDSFKQKMGELSFVLGVE